MAKYLRDLQPISTISGKLSMKMGPQVSNGEFNVSSAGVTWGYVLGEGSIIVVFTRTSRT